MEQKIKNIKANKIKCKKCGDIIESTYTHDFKTCSCGCCSVDGGREYLRRCFNAASADEAYEEMSEVVEE